MIKFDNEPKLSVGILLAEKIDFQLFGNFTLNNTPTSGIFHATLKGNEIHLTGKDIDITAKELYISNQDLDKCRITISDVVIGIDFHWERKENETFQGDIKLLVENGKVRAVNVLPIENYLKSVISSEMSSTSNANLLKAHAVISRSWLLAQIQKTKELEKKHESYITCTCTEDEIVKWYDREDHTLFDVCADDHCQRYQGITKAHTATVVEAINETNGVVLTYADKICDARFYKSCGGVTEAFEKVWEPIEHPYLTKIVDDSEIPEGYEMDLTIEANAEKWIRTSPPAFCNTNDKKVLSQVLNDYDQETQDFYRWKVEYSQAEISELIKKKSGIDFGEIIDLVPLERGVSGRIITLKIVGTKKTMKVGKELEIRKYLSNSHLYSSAFVVDKVTGSGNVPDKFILVGAGWGHGVGLCQIGAAVMGAKGYNYKEILLHYFKNADLTKIY